MLGLGIGLHKNNFVSANVAPFNTITPVISGTATVGSILTSTTGTWEGTAPITYTYQWLRNGVNISGATSSTYTLVSADIIQVLRCKVIATNSVGSVNALSNELTERTLINFQARVAADSGTFEAEECLKDSLPALIENNPSLCITPNAVKAGKLYSIVPTDGTGDLTVTRATSATRVNSAGLIENVGANIARLDYTNGSCPSILVEPQRTNLVFPSATATTQTRTVTATAHTLSFYGTGTVTLSGVATSTLVGTGINNKVSLTFTPTAGSLILTVSGSVINWQLEVGSNATSHIPTTTATVTRNADVISKTGISSLIGQTEGTLFIDFNYKKTTDVYRRVFAISNNTSNNLISINLTQTGSLEVYIINGGVTQVAFPSNILTANTRYKIAVGYVANNVVLYINGTLRNTDLTCTIPTCSGVYLGKVETAGSAAFLNDSINSAMLFKTRLINSQLATLTTP